MMRIAVCESNKIFRETLKKLLTEYFRVKQVNYTIDFFVNGKSLLENDTRKYNLFLLEISKEKETNGLETARILRKYGIQSDIVFITNYIEFAYRAFEVSALRYLLKPMSKETLYKAMDLSIRRKEEHDKRLLTLHKGQSFLQIPCENILYFETIERKLCAHTTKKDYLIDNKITDLDALLSDKNFFRVHKSYLVNLAYVQEYDQTTATMLNDDIVYISRLRLKAFKESFMQYLIKNNRLEYSMYG